MRAKHNLRIHAWERQVRAVIFSRASGIEPFVIELHQPVPAFRIRPDPVLKCLLNGFLFCLCESGLFLVQHRFSLAISILNIIEDSDVTQVQCLLYDLVRIDAFCAVSAVRGDISAIIAFAFNIPLRGNRRIADMDVPRHIPWCSQ